jgi:hypothetical protein
VIAERFDVRSVTAAGTLDFINQRPTWFDNGFKFQLDGTGNYEGTVLATMLDTGSAGYFVDITSALFGGATFTQAKKGIYDTGKLYNAVRLNITSVQATKNVLLSGTWI